MGHCLILRQLLALLTACAALACGSPESTGDAARSVTIYVSTDRVFSEPVLREYERQSGVRVNAVYDTEETKSTGLANRLLAERSRPQADVFWSNEPVRTLVLKSRDVLAPYRSPNASGIPEALMDPDAYWTGFSARIRVIAYNTKLVSEQEAPTSVFDLVDPRWKGRAALADPRFGSTSFHVAALYAKIVAAEGGCVIFHDEISYTMSADALRGEKFKDIKKAIIKYRRLKLSIVGTTPSITSPVAPWSADAEGVRELRDVYHQRYPGEEGTLNTVHGYTVAMAFVAVLEKACAKNDLSRDGVLRAFHDTNAIKAKSLTGELRFSLVGRPSATEMAWMAVSPDLLALEEDLSDLELGLDAMQYVLFEAPPDETPAEIEDLIWPGYHMNF